MFHSAEQWIQYQKCLMFGDNYTANMILRMETPLDAKRLSHRRSGVDHTKWQLNNYAVCLDGVKEKFWQNPPLMSMLKATKPKLLVEVSLDKLWGTGVGIHDSDVLKREKWSGHGWLSQMLHDIRDGED